MNSRSIPGKLWDALRGQSDAAPEQARDVAAKVVIYTTGYCGYCHAAKRLLDTKGVDYEEIAADRRPELRAWLRQASGQHTVPQIFINGASIGGYTELRGLERQGELDGRLAEPSADDDPPLRA